MVEEWDFVIIEDSVAICLRIKQYLERLGAQKIHIANNGEDGIKLFNEIKTEKSTPIVFLDYNLPDSDGFHILSEILESEPETKIILETARQRSDEVITNTIAAGAYNFLGKPFGFEEVKKIVDELEKDEEYSKAPVDKDEIKSFLKSHSMVSVAKIASQVGLEESKVLSELQDLEKEGFVMKSDDTREIKCDNCGSINTKQLYSCPSCYSMNFVKDRAIEHYDCGNIAPARTYTNDKCPNCRKDLKILGVDYRIIENYYSCNDCGDKFPEFSTNFRCLTCNKKFCFDDAEWSISPSFRVLKN